MSWAVWTACGPPLSGLVASKKPTALPTRKPRRCRPLSSLAAVPLTPGNLGPQAAAAESEEQTLAELLEAEGLAAEPEQEVMAGYTLFEVEQDNIRHAPRSALLGVGPMNICVFTAEAAAAARSPIEWYTYDGLKRWDYSQRTLTADTTPGTSRANFNAVGTIPDGWCNNGDSSIVSEVSS